MKLFGSCFAILLVLLVGVNGAGQITDMESNSIELKPVLEFAELMLDRAVNSLFTHEIGSVLKAQKQIVSGVKYYLTFEFRETTCLKSKPKEGPCDTTRTEICTVQVWSRPWLSDHKMQLLDFSCKAQ